MRVVISSILVSPAASYRAAVRDRTKGEPSMPAGWKAIARSKAVWVLVVALGFCVEPVPPVPAYAGAEGRTATTAYETHVADRAAYQLDPSPFTEAVTIVSRITFPNEADLRNVDTIWLAGFSSEGAAPPVDLALRFRRDGWFQLWTLGLDTNLDLFPSQLRPASGTGEWAGYKLLTLESGKFPEAGHTYETTISYAPAEGYLAVSVVDVTTGEPFYRGALQLKPWDHALHAGTAVQYRGAAGEGEPVALPQLMDVRPEFVPVGIGWRLLERPAGGGWISVTRVDRRNELTVQIDTGAELPLPGEIRLVLLRGSGDEEILHTVSGPAGVVEVPIDAARLPAGPAVLRLEYVQDGKVSFSQARSIDAGVVEARAASLRVDPVAQVVEGALIVEADGRLEGVTVRGQVAAEARSLTEPHVYTYRRDLDQALSYTEAGTVTIPFRFPLPPEPTRWTVELETEIVADPGIRVRVEVPAYMRTVSASREDAQELVRRIKDQYIEATLLPGPVSLGIPPLREDGSWADVNYADQSVGGWQAVPHLDRTFNMARAYATPGGPHEGSRALLDQIVAALGYWTKNRFRNPNWWWNVIWQPQRLGDILLLVGDAIPDDLFQEALQIISGEVLSRPASHYTGANLVWNEGNRLRLGLITGDLDTVAFAFEMMTSELRIVPFGAEGIQVDGSFHQHGSMLYNGGYGESFAGDLAHFAYVARGTQLFPADALSVLVDYVLDGTQWMIRGSTLDYSVTGRVFSRQHTSGNASYVQNLVRTLASLPDAPRREELQAFLARLAGAGEPLTGNRYFWTSDFMVHHRAGYYISVKASSDRTLATEIGNYENLKGHHLGDGMMFIMRSGREYDNAFPLWNWELLPGSTVRHMEHQLLVDGSWLTVKGAGNPAGGVSDGMYGALAMYLERDSARARKAWFFFDREVVALGTDIHVPPGATVTTAINQTRLAGSVTVGAAAGQQTLEPNVHAALGDVAWVHHDGVAYVFPEPAAVHVSNEVRTGRWSDINSVYSDQLIAQPLFTLWIDHSGSGAKDYAYIVAPGIGRDEVAAYAETHGVGVVENSSRVQAVWHDGLRQLQAVFWQAGSVAAPGGWSVSVDAPVLLLVKETADGFEVTAGSLDRKPGDVVVRLEPAGPGASSAAVVPAGPGRPAGSVEAVFTFPEGDYVGRSVTQRMP